MALTAQRVRELMDYDAISGVLTWRPRSGRAGAKVGALSKAGHVARFGYLTVCVDDVLYQAHRLAWLHYYGEWPVLHIDHRNGDRLDNRIANLRDVPNVINRENMRRARVDNETGALGVTVDRRRGGFNAKIKVRGRMLILGNFPTADTASAAYWQAKHVLHEGAGASASEAELAKRLAALSWKTRKDNTTGFQGVSPHQGDKFRARLKRRGVMVHQSLWDTPEKAHAAYVAARQRIGEVAP